MNLGEVSVLPAGNNGLWILEYVGRSGTGQPLRQLKVTQKRCFLM